ncbi:MAG: LOG family protein [Anaerolineales bacterium]|jgi:hypothetical protein|nr:LOG family protein [Anaerolineales bacterium]
MKIVTVFGGSEPRPGDAAYLAAQRLGRFLAEAGFGVASGGYIGTMEAVSRGAAEAGGHVIGVTCAEIEAFRPNRANLWVKEEFRTETLPERILKMIQVCDAAIALPGGSGTLAEVALMWNLLYVRAIPVRPLILVGQEWQTTLSQFISLFERFVPPSQADLLAYAADGEAAVALLKNNPGFGASW